VLDGLAAICETTSLMFCSCCRPLYIHRVFCMSSSCAKHQHIVNLQNSIECQKASHQHSPSLEDTTTTSPVPLEMIAGGEVAGRQASATMQCSPVVFIICISLLG
jgi:hypothetical protein